MQIDLSGLVPLTVHLSCCPHLDPSSRSHFAELWPLPDDRTSHRQESISLSMAVIRKEIEDGLQSKETISTGAADLQPNHIPFPVTPQ